MDTEIYVPAGDRSKGQFSMKANAANPDHILLGGVFRRDFPLLKKDYGYEQFWGWKKEEEKQTLEKIYSFFQESWKMIDGKSSRHPDLIVSGTGISRFDLPALLVKSMEHNIDSKENLFNTYFKTKIVDLGEVGIPLFSRNPSPVLYPKTANALVSRLGINARKASGKSVWDMYDGADYDGIKQRTLHELETCVEIARKLVSWKC